VFSHHPGREKDLVLCSFGDFYFTDINFGHTSTAGARKPPKLRTANRGQLPLN